MTNPAWLAPMMAVKAQYPTARIRICQSTRYAILDSTEADGASLLAAMKELVGRPVILDATIPDGEVWLETEGISGWTVVTKITLQEKA